MTRSTVARPRSERLPATLDLPPGGMYCTERPLTVEEFYELVDEDSHAELIDGVIVMPAPVTVRHEAVFRFIFTVLREFVEQSGLGLVFGSRTAVRIHRYTAREPDVLFVRADRLDIIHEQQIVGPPDLVIEIISPGDRPGEIIMKQAQYEAIGVPQLWRIDLPHQEALIFRLARSGQYEVAWRGKKGTLRSEVVPGFEIKAEWLCRKPGSFPPTFEIVSALLKKTETRRRRKVSKRRPARK